MAGNATTVDEILALYSATPFEGGDSFLSPDDATASWVLIAGYLVFWMHAGFSMLEAGSVQSKNAINIMFKNIMTVCIGAISYYLLGFGFAYGSDNVEDGTFPFIGSGGFALKDPDYVTWFFQYAFCATAATIVSGAVAGRITLHAYFIIATAMTIFIYPVVSHWVWATGGWLSAFTAPEDRIFFSSWPETCGMLDYAGSGVVHMTGGVAALVGAIILGPRVGRFEDPEQFKGHNNALATLGTFILWFGWYGFNCGSTLAFDASNASKVAVTTTLAPSAAAVTGIIVTKLLDGHFDLPTVLNCVLAGLVSITAGCSTISDSISIVVGAIGALVYIGSSKLLVKLEIDDPIGAAPVHGFAGVWGVLATGIFANVDDVLNAYSCEMTDNGMGGLEGYQFAIQLIGVLVIILWVGALSGAIFFAMKMAGILRVSEEVEQEGLDASEHGGNAYAFGEPSESKKVIPGI